MADVDRKRRKNIWKIIIIREKIVQKLCELFQFENGKKSFRYVKKSLWVLKIYINVQSEYKF